MIKNNNIEIVLVLDNIRSMHNIGSIFRTCDSLGGKKIILCGICAVPPNKEIHKTALGATDSVPWKYYNNTNDAILKLKSEDYEIVSIEQNKNSISLNEFQPKKRKLALILGNEVKGIHDDIIKLSESIIEITQHGIKKSMNVGIVAGIAIWSILNRTQGTI